MTDITTKVGAPANSGKLAGAPGGTGDERIDDLHCAENARLSYHDQIIGIDQSISAYWAVCSAATVAAKADDEIDRLRAEVAGLRAALDRLLCATEGHDVCPYAKAEARYVLTPEGK